MKTHKTHSNILKNQKGIITVSFMLTLIIILFFVLSFFILSMALSHISISQYMAYSSARKLSLSGVNQQSQKDSAKDYYVRLRAQFFKPNAFTSSDSNWFIIGQKLEGGETGGDVGYLGSSIGYDLKSPRPKQRKMFYGAGVDFKTQRLVFSIPFLMDKQNLTHVFKITAFLGREPSRAECQSFNAERGSYIKQLYPSVNMDIALVNTSTGDNGC